MARHRSPSGARPAPGRDAPVRAPQTPGTRRLPPPPAASRGRSTVAAAAAGAVVAAGQTFFTVLVDDGPDLVSAVVPIAETASTAEDEPAAAPDAIGGDQLLPDALSLAPLDPRSAVDVKNLAKAVDIGKELAQRAELVESALAGGAPEASVVDDTVYVKPVLGRFTSGFGARWGTTHQGIDIANAIGTPIYAMTDGVVEESGPASGFGMWVVLRHSDGTRTVYGHINRSLVSVGDRVEAGDEIAELGNRGRSTGPHLHFEVWGPDGTKLNPATWLAKRGIDY